MYRAACKYFSIDPKFLELCTADVLRRFFCSQWCPNDDANSAKDSNGMGAGSMVLLVLLRVHAAGRCLKNMANRRFCNRYTIKINMPPPKEL